METVEKPNYEVFKFSAQLQAETNRFQKREFEVIVVLIEGDGMPDIDPEIENPFGLPLIYIAASQAETMAAFLQSIVRKLTAPGGLNEVTGE